MKGRVPVNKIGLKVKCVICGKQFSTIPSRIKEGRGKYCSKECYYKSKKGKPAHNYSRIKRICKTCGKEFRVNKARAEKGGGKFCSQKCYSKSLEGKNIIGGWNKGKMLKERVKFRCLTCDKIFQVLQSKLDLGSVKGSYCSYDCYWKSLKGKPSPDKGKTYEMRYGKERAMEIIKKVKEARLKQIIPIKDTKIEVKMQNELKRRHISFEKHIPLLGQPDIFIKPNICIFCDGDYFHANPKNYDGERIILKGKVAKDIWKKDKSINHELEKLGFKVFRFWGSEIKEDVKSCIDKVGKYLK